MKRKKPIIDNQNGFGEWEGGYMGAKKQKLEEQFLEAAQKGGLNKSNLFSGISIFVNGYTNPTASELKCLMMEHGGIFHHYKRPYTSFTIASNLSHVKIKAITSEKIVRPDWIVDSIRENRILDYARYLLYTNHTESQPKLRFEKVIVKNKISSPCEETTELSNIMLELDSLNEQLNESLHIKNGNNPNQRMAEVTRPSVSPDLFEAEEDMFEEDKLLSTSHQPIETERIENNKTLETPPQAGHQQPMANRKVARVATDPNFLTEFFQNSRLHHIATLGAGFKQYITELREKSNGKFEKREKLKQISKTGETRQKVDKTVMHIDMDCFFVSVGLRRRPHLRGQPVAVTHSKGTEGGPAITRPGMDRQKEIALYNQRMTEKLPQTEVDSKKIESRLQHIDDNNSLSEIASCSYEARAKGVKNGMFVGAALKLCPDLKTIPYDFEAYKEVAYQLYDTMAQYTLEIEAVSCDEMFVDLTELLSKEGISCEQFITYVRNEIRDKTGCPCSAGVGGNRLQARLATRKAKPNGQFCLNPVDVTEYMRNIPIADLPGVGRSTSYRLSQMKLETCGDLQMIALSTLQKDFGKKFGETLYQFSRGIDERPLVFGQVRKSVSVEVNYGIRFTEQQEVDTFLRQLCSEVYKRLTEIKQQGKNITLKVMVRAKDAPVETAKFMGHGFCDTINKSTSLTNYTADLEVITYNVLSLMKAMALPPEELRGIGIHISKFPTQRDTVSKGSAGNVLKQMFQKAEKQKQAKPKPLDLDKSFVESLKRVADCVADMTLPDDVISEKLKVPEEQILNESVQVWSPAMPTLAAIPQNQSTPSRNPPTSTEIRLERSPVSRLSIEPKPSTSRACSPVSRLSLEPKPSTSRVALAPSKRGRGRPRKIDVVKKSGKNLFKTGLTRQPEPEIVDDLEGLDLTVLAELPADIREEVIRDHKRQRILEQQKQQRENDKKLEAVTEPAKKIQVDLEFLEALPPNLRQQVEEQIKKEGDKFLVRDSTPVKAGNSSKPVESENSSELPNVDACAPKDTQPSEDNVLLQADWRQQINSWLQSGDTPESYDVEMLAKNAQQLVQTKRIEQLHLVLKMLFRLVSEKENCGWHQAYTKIVNYAQSEMFDIYNSKLRVQCRFQCRNVECNSFI